MLEERLSSGVGHYFHYECITGIIQPPQYELTSANFIEKNAPFLDKLLCSDDEFSHDTRTISIRDSHFIGDHNDGRLGAGMASIVCESFT